MPSENSAIVKVKCLECSLHFVIHTWHKQKWDLTRKEAIYCPECGDTSPKMVWSEDTQDEIYTHVPGATAYLGTIPVEE